MQQAKAVQGADGPPKEEEDTAVSVVTLNTVAAYAPTPRIEARIAGGGSSFRYKCLSDTGATRTVIDKNVAERHGLRPVANRAIKIRGKWEQHGLQRNGEHQYHLQVTYHKHSSLNFLKPKRQSVSRLARPCGPRSHTQRLPSAYQGHQGKERKEGGPVRHCGPINGCLQGRRDKTNEGQADEDTPTTSSRQESSRQDRYRCICANPQRRC
jgi:hypothetical protein